MSSESMHFVVGLGNPGPEYARTRHNVGFRVVETLQRRWGLGPWRSRFDAAVCSGRMARRDEEVRVVLARPMTFMNASGRAVRRMLDYHKAGPSGLLVVYDEMALELGRLRARPEGSAGGHNGLSDIVRQLGTQQIGRLRLGIGAAPGRMDWADYVLSRFRPDEEEEIAVAVELAADAAEDWIFRGMTYVMERYNRRAEP